MHFTWEINIGNLLTSIPILAIMIKMYGDWRIYKYRINIMWSEYMKEHHIIEGNR